MVETSLKNRWTLARLEEFEGCVEEGVNIRYLLAPKKIEPGTNGYRLQITYAKMALEVINAAIYDVPADMVTAMHLCRGNVQSTFVASGGYEPVAETLFNEIEAC